MFIRGTFEILSMRLLGGPCEILGRLIWGRKLLRLLGGASGPRPKTVFQNEFADLAVVHKSAIDDDGEGLSVTLRKLNHEAIQADPDEQVAGRLSQKHDTGVSSHHQNKD